ncbi:MAG TPA: HAD-IA family hydrolase [Acidobacteriaceae bacterium]
MVTIAVKGILFDMDGVLVSSLGSVERSWAKYGELRGVDGATAIKTAHGKRAIETIRLLRPDLDEQAELDLIEDIECADIDDVQVLGGVKELLEKMPAGHWTIVTSATQRLARVRLEYAGLAVPERFISADMVEHGKPDPEPYLRGAALLGFAPGECLVIEDAPAGVQAGRAAGARVLGTLFSHTAEELAGAEWLVASLEGVEVRETGTGVELRFEPVSGVGAGGEP